MLMLRLQRIGRRNEAHFKIVVIEKTKGPKSQKYVDIVGSYNPKLGRIQIDEEKAKKWISQGVQPSDTVYNMLVSKGVIEGKKKNVLPNKSPIVDEERIAREKEEIEAMAIKEAEEKTSKDNIETLEEVSSKEGSVIEIEKEEIISTGKSIEESSDDISEKTNEEDSVDKEVEELKETKENEDEKKED